MSFRTRISVLVASTAAVTVAIAALAVYFIVRGQMLDQVDASLRDRLPPAGMVGAKVVSVSGAPVHFFGFGMQQSATAPAPAPGTAMATCAQGTVAGPVTAPTRECSVQVVQVQGLKAPALGGAGGYTQVIDLHGNAALLPGEPVVLPVTAADRAVAASNSSNVVFEDATVAHTPVRIATTAIGDGTALQVARPLDEVNTVLARLRWILVGICAAVVLVAGALGRLVARRTLRPVDRLMLATEHVAGTRDLRRRIEEPGNDELGRLAHSFNRMLTALDESERTQRQLVADASHELRTPLSSLRTNIEVLARNGDLDSGERERMLSDVLGQVERLSRLVADLIDLARGDEPSSQVRADVALDELVVQCVEVARTHYPVVQFAVDASPVTVHGDPGRIARAVGNLLDNAGKWSPASGGVVDVSVRGDGSVSVRDRGPGIAPEDVAHVFQRFWRAPDAKRSPGAGLGLAIVQQVAQSHGGDVVVESPAGGGALLRLRIPSVS
jgi:two-component system sensor histidine kinase MprB